MLIYLFKLFIAEYQNEFFRFYSAFSWTGVNILETSAKNTRNGYGRWAYNRRRTVILAAISKLMRKDSRSHKTDLALLHNNIGTLKFNTEQPKQRSVLAFLSWEQKKVVGDKVCVKWLGYITDKAPSQTRYQYSSRLRGQKSSARFQLSLIDFSCARLHNNTKWPKC